MVCAGSLMKIDVIVLTKNSGYMLEKCLTSIYKNVPVNKLIVVDGYSTDNTLQVLQKFNKKYGNVILVQDKGTRGHARQIGIGKVETEWFMFVDSDVVLCEDWFEKAKAYIQENVGAIWGIEIWSVLKNPTVVKLFEYITLKIFETRGGTHDILIRYDAVKDIRIPEKLHVYEDAYIKEWITKKGYKVMGTYDPYCIHYRPKAVWDVKTSIVISSNEIRFGLLHKYPKLLLSYGFYIAIFLYQNLAHRFSLHR
jgi:glycosyltransferase involved in cell wall biosynthesis